MNIQKINEWLGIDADSLLSHQCDTISKDLLYRPSLTYVNDVMLRSNRSPPGFTKYSRHFQQRQALRNGLSIYSILPVDQGIEHSAGASFARNPIYFNP